MCVLLWARYHRDSGRPRPALDFRDFPVGKVSRICIVSGGTVGQLGYFMLVVVYIHDMASFDLMEALSESASVSFNFDDLLYARI